MFKISLAEWSINKLARGVSVKPKVWDFNGNNTDIDLLRMMKIVVDSGYHGHAGIEWGPEGRELEGVKELRQRRETVRNHLSARSL
jgi:hypothetical protein